MTSLLLYGARGFTGKLIFEAAHKALEVQPAARPAADVADDGVLPLDLADADALRDALGAHAAVLNCAGPFAHTWRPLVEACLETGTCAPSGPYSRRCASGMPAPAPAA